MKDQIQSAMAVLVGRPLWACRRAADMATLQFGLKTQGTDFFGRPAEWGEYAIHIQCPWRIVRGDRIMVGSSDLYYPAGYENEKEEIPPGFDWDRDPNRRDELLRSLFDDGKRNFIVQAVEAGMAGAVRISMSDNLSLDIFPNDSLSHEHWRLLQPGNDERHFVVSARGIEAGSR